MASALDFLKYFVKFQTRNFIYLEWNFEENSHFLDFHLTCHFFVRHTLSDMENFKFQFYVAY